MKKIDLFFIYNESLTNPLLEVSNESCKIKIYIKNLSNYDLNLQINKINNLVVIYNKIQRINIIFDTKINLKIVNIILTKLSDILYKYYPITRQIKLYQVDKESNALMNELTVYKNIVMDPNKTPESYLEFIKSNVPPKYNIEITKLSNDGVFPLTYFVGVGSNYNSYFVHIKPKIIDSTKKDIFLIGKSVTYDAGGLNIKLSKLEEMKIDMCGSAIILSVLKLLCENNYDSKNNIHLLIPIVENMISSKSLKPGAVIQTMNNKKVEVVNTDAEGRLCIVDCLDWINKKLVKNPSNTIILDIATLTGNTQHITSGISSIIMSNDIGQKYANKLISIGEEIGEYLDYLKIRREYLDMLNTPVADIKNINMEEKAGCIIGGTFISYFANPNIPWIHIDLGVATFVNSTVLSYGINLLYEFIKLN
jgi:leucyl aminopeptidase